MMIPGVKVVSPSSPVDVIGLMAAAVRDPNPVIVHEQKALYASKGEVPEGEIVDTLGTARTCARAATDHRGSRADGPVSPRSRRNPAARIQCGRRSDRRALACAAGHWTILGSVARTGRLFTVEENPRLCGWGAEIASIVADEAFWDLDGPIVRITTPHIPLPAADHLEDLALPSVAQIVDTVRRVLNG